MDKDNEIDLIQTIQKKDKVIDLMANEFAENMKAVNEEYAVDEEFLSKESIKDYFYKKVEEQEQEEKKIVHYSFECKAIKRYGGVCNE